MTCQETCSVTGKVQRTPCDFFGTAVAGKRRLLRCLCEEILVLHDCGGKFRVDEPWAERIYADFRGSELVGERLRERNDSGLRRAVEPLQRRGLEPGHARDVDDRARR